MRPVEEFPQLSTLTYGSRISPDVISEFCDVSLTDRRYDFLALCLADALTGALRETQGIEYDLVHEKDFIVILTPEEMVEKVDVRRKTGIRKMRKAVRKGQAIPAEELTPEIKADLNKYMLRTGLLLQFARKRKDPMPVVETTH